MTPFGLRDAAGDTPPLSAEMLVAIETELQQVLAHLLPAPTYAEISAMVRHHFGWEVGAAPGKRIRPLLTLLTAASSAGDWRQAVPAAAAIEIIHNFSLIHDDIEDASEARRGRVTVWKRWGIPQALNTGDFLHVAAHIAVARLLDRGVTESTAFAAQRELDQAALQLTLGQHMDLALEQQAAVTLEDYMRMVGGKTAALLAGAAAAGARVAESPPPIIDAYRTFGWRLGVAFQLLDDLLGIWGAPDMTGKSASDDMRQGKKTYPVVFGLRRSPAFAHAWASDRGPARDVDGLRRALEACGADRATRREAERFTQDAMDALQEAGPRPPAADELHALVERLLHRDR
jgi:geranylgeranyl diphosphate synthase type I